MKEEAAETAEAVKEELPRYKFCPNCGAPILGGRFCAKCGYKLFD
ncbi:MAG: 50S ribosomal protein L32 [Lachnospiraceae bacterium]|nr:50S ribosomal protein L32 [Lachnospiraceae bacterium]